MRGCSKVEGGKFEIPRIIIDTSNEITNGTLIMVQYMIPVDELTGVVDQMHTKVVVCLKVIDGMVI